jgi:hypothetical protein
MFLADLTDQLQIVRTQRGANVENEFSGLYLRIRYGTSVVGRSNKLTTTDEVRLILNHGVKLY